MTTVLHFADDHPACVVYREDLPQGGDWEERQKRFRRFDNAAFAMMKRAILVGDVDANVAARIERDIVAALKAMPETMAEMTLYTTEIEISVSASQHRSGWWWGKKTIYKHLNADVIFNPYRSSLSAWTDPKAPDGVVLFQ